MSDQRGTAAVTEVSVMREADSVITADRQRVWAALTDPELVAELTPFVDSITATEKHWTWQLQSVTVPGLDLAPRFTERMLFNEPESIHFTHNPRDDDTDTASVTGAYILHDDPTGTALHIELEITVDVTIPQATVPVLEKTLEQVLDEMGAKFSQNLLNRLNASEVD